MSGPFDFLIPDVKTAFGSSSGPLPAAAIVGFRRNAQLQDHFNRDGGDFGASTAGEYEQQADSFLNGPKGGGVLEKVRSNGDIVRYNPATVEFGIAKPRRNDPDVFQTRSRRARLPTNLDYFSAQ